jgi:hypothetical protein
LQEIGYAFLVSARQSNTNLLAHSGQCRTADWRDFTDRELTAGRIEESLDMLEVLLRADGLVDDGLVTAAGLGRQRMRNLRGLLQLIGKVPGQ